MSMPFMVYPSDLYLTRYIKQQVTTFVLAINNFSTNYDLTVTIDDIDRIQKEYPEVTLFVIINKNIFNDELQALEDLLERLEERNIGGIFFYDLALLSIHQRRGFQTPLVWYQTHMVTNHRSCNFYFQEGVKYGVLSSEITVDEIVSIVRNTRMRLIVPILGYPVVAHSNRKLLTNFYHMQNKKETSSQLEIVEPVSKGVYEVKEDASGTTFYKGRLLNGTNALCLLKDEDVSYFYLNFWQVPNDQQVQILALYQTLLQEDLTEEERDALIKKSEEILKSDDTGFFFQKTIYKVKKHG